MTAPTTQIAGEAMTDELIIELVKQVTGWTTHFAIPSEPLGHFYAGHHHQASVDDILRFARALLASKGAVPEGFKLVPIEPTKEMIQQACSDHGYPSGDRTVYKRGYQSMLAASPTAPAQPMLEKLAGILASEIECDVFEQHVAPALDVARKVFAGPIAPAASCDEDAAEQADEAVTLPFNFEHRLTPFGMLVRALRIVADTTLYDMAKALSSTPATLSAVECGRKPLTEEMVIDTYVFFTKLGVLDTLHALNAARAKDSK